MEKYNNKARRFSGINTCWVIQNSTPFLETLDKINSRNNAKGVSSFDFSTLYTKIPHVKLFDELFGIIKFIFKGGASTEIFVNKLGTARWTKKNKAYKYTYGKDKIMKAVKYLL